MLLPLLLLLVPLAWAAERGVRVNCEENRFELDGKPFSYIAGEVHYFRIPRQLWNDRLQRMRAMGLNVAQVYVAWNWHEEVEGVYNFEGDRNLTEFLRLAEANGLYVNLRMGPYACAEWEQGGFPWWVLAYEGMQLRSKEGPFLGLAKRWMKRLVEEVKDLQYPDGPIILAQVENEYGSYGSDHEYMNELTRSMKEYGMDKALAYTTDGFWNVKNGVAEGAYPTVDFGNAKESDVEDHFQKQMEAAKCGPHVNSEFYTGWFDAWHNRRTSLPSTQAVVDTMEYMLKRNASFSFYMAHGGTNFAFWNGAEVDSYIVSSYDYGAPIDEAGQITDQFLGIRRRIKQIPGWTNQPLAVPKNHSTFTFSKMPARRLNGSLPDLLLKVKQNCKKVERPEVFEQFNQSYGYAVYTTEFPSGTPPKYLFIEFLRDLAYVFIGDEYQGWLGNCTTTTCSNRELRLNQEARGPLRIVVENLGRLNFNHGNDYKGIRSAVQGDWKELLDWEECGVATERIPQMVEDLVEANGPSAFAPPEAPNELGIYVSDFKLQHAEAKEDIGLHTFFDGVNWGKGQLYLNNINVGRFWPSAGPQRTLFVPGVFFDLTGQKENKLVIVNFEPRPPTGEFDFVDSHIWTEAHQTRVNRWGRHHA